MAKKKGGGNNNNNGGGNNNNNGGGGNKEDGGGKKEVGMSVVVLKIDLHCEGCAAKAIKAVRSFDGVESAKVGDGDLTKLTVVGKLDPTKLLEKVEEKIKKKAQLISPVPKKDNIEEAKENNNKDGDKENNKKDNKDGDNENNCEQKKKPQQQQQQQTDEKNKKSNNKKDKNKPKELPETTVVLKIQLHCQGCIKKIQKVVSKSKGFKEMSIDKPKDLLTVKGAIDSKALVEKLKEKLKRPVEIVQPKKLEGGGGGGGDKAKAAKSGGDGEGCEKEKGKGKKGGDEKAGKGNSGGGGGKVVVEGQYKMECGGGDQVRQMESPYEYGYESGYTANLVHAPQLFSDENPNACVVM